MAFKNLSERFDEKAEEIYGRFSGRDGRNGTFNVNPILETKPNAPHPDVGKDSRSVPLRSIAQDAKRMGKFLTSSRGLLWMLDQQNLQTGNTFSETRVINPLFVIGNVIPFLHLKRPLADASGEDLSGDLDHKSAGSTNNIGSAGRLQKHTSKTAIGFVTTGGKNSVYSKIIKLLPPTRLIQTVAGVLSVVQGNGILGIDQRPELDMDSSGKYKTYYSVDIWKGFQKVDGPVDNLERVGNALRKGNIKGAIDSLGRAGSTIIKDAGTVIGDIATIGKKIISLFGKKERGKETTNNSTGSELVARAETTSRVWGRRYFITDATEADRYLPGSIDFDQYGAPRVSLAYLDRTPTLPWSSIHGSAISNYHLGIPDTPLPREITTRTPAGNLFSSATPTGGILGTIGGFIAKGSRFINKLLVPQSTFTLGVRFEDLLGTSPSRIPLVGARGTFAPSATTANDPNPAEAAMKFSGLSLRQAYEVEKDERLRFVLDNLPIQIDRWRSSLPINKMGFRGGIPYGKDLGPEPYQIVDIDSRGYKKYFYDDLNSTDLAIMDLTGETVVTNEAINRQRDIAEGLIDLFIFDFVNKKAIPFRAYIVGLTESVTPKFTETEYVGRIERNIVYSGVARKLNFSLLVHAFNADELTTIWRKINYLTGLCYPSTYSNGFMVPPFVKLTLGDIYNNQPGYIESITNTVEDDTPWETTPTIQVPHGITINITFAVIEKGQMRTSDLEPIDNEPFYAYGQNRANSQPANRGPSVSSNSSETNDTSTPGANRNPGTNPQDIINNALNAIANRFINKIGF